MKLISGGAITVHILYPICLVILYIFFHEACELIGSSFNYYSDMIIPCCLMFFAEMLAGTIFFLTDDKLSPVTINSIESTYPGSSFTSYSQKRYPITTMLSIASLSLFDLLDVIGENTLIHFFTQTQYVGLKDVCSIIQFITIAFLCTKVLKSQLFLHHYVSLILIGIGMIIAFFEQDFMHLKYLLIPLLIILQSFKTLRCTFEKWGMEKGRLNPFLIIFLEGILGFVISVILLIMIWFICAEDKSWYCQEKRHLMNLKINDLYYVLIFVVYCFGLNICAIKTIYHYSPIQLILTLFIRSLFHWLGEMIKGNSKFLVCGFIGGLLILISNIIYNEVIILHFWRLDYNTKEMIERRSLIDIEDSNTMIKTLDEQRLVGEITY